MGIEQNKETVLRFMRSMETEPDFSLACDDMRWWMPGQGYKNRAEFLAILDKVYRVLKTRVILDITHVTAEGDRVAVECNGSAELHDGTRYDNSYHFLFLLRDGKILEQREHADSAYAVAVLGPLFAAQAEH